MKELVVAACGGGTNSKAGLIKWVNDNKPLDLVLFADTGGERPETYCEVEKFSHWLARRGYPEIITVKKVDKHGNIMTLEHNCLENKMLPSIAYFGQKDSTNKKCSLKFKIGPQHKYVNNWEPAKEFLKTGGKITKLIFYDAGEEHRVLSAQYEKIKNPDKKYHYRYPLYEDGIYRSDCLEIIQNEGLSLPGKSSCFFCPSMRQMEIRNMASKYPELAARAINMERSAKPNLHTIQGLGVHWSWENFLRQGEMFPEMFPEARGIEICCDCYDG